MALTPRKDEKATIVALLESEEFDDADKLAGAVLKAAFDIFQHRNLYLLGASNAIDEPVALFGPFASERDAERAARDAVYNYGRSMPLWTVDLLNAAPPGVDKEMCKCGHPRGTHEHPKTAGICLAGAKTVKTRPCPCDHFQ